MMQARAYVDGRPSPPLTPSLLDSPLPSLLDSPRLTPSSSIVDTTSLARLTRGADDFDRARVDSPCYQSSLPAIKRGVLWQQRERLWSRWKGRYFVLTSDYLHCFKRRTSGEGLTQMGHFIFKVRLVDLEMVEWLPRRNYNAIALTTRNRSEPRVLLRAPEGLDEWFDLLEECTQSSKERRRALYERGFDRDRHVDHHPGPWRSSQSSLPLESASLSPRVELLLRQRLDLHLEQRLDQLLDQCLDPQDMHRDQQADEPQVRGQAGKVSSRLDRRDAKRDFMYYHLDHQRDDRPEQRNVPAQVPHVADHRLQHRLSQRLDQRRQSLLLETPPPSAPATLRPFVRPAPPVMPSTTKTTPLYHRLNHDVFFMSAELPMPLGEAMSWRWKSRSERPTQV